MRGSTDALALGEHARAARLGDLERALVLALRDQHVHVGPIELDQLRQERQLVVHLQQIRPRLLDRSEGGFEVPGGSLQVVFEHGDLREAGVGRPLDRGHAVGRRQRPFVQGAAALAVAAPDGDLGRVHVRVDLSDAAGSGRYPAAPLVESLRFVPLSEQRVRGREIDRPYRGVALQPGAIGDRERLVEVRQRQARAAMQDMGVAKAAERFGQGLRRAVRFVGRQARCW